MYEKRDIYIRVYIFMYDYLCCMYVVSKHVRDVEDREGGVEHHVYYNFLSTLIKNKYIT